MTEIQTITLGHSPDPDDAFMFYGLATGALDSGPYHFKHILQDIQTLNERAGRCELDITAISVHCYPYVASDYAITRCGASMGEEYGPMVVARKPMSIERLAKVNIAVPGTLTSAYLTLKLMLGREPKHEVVMFDQIISRVASGEFDAGLIIHEGQLTYQNHDLHSVVDLGKWWFQKEQLPLPLGCNVIRRSLGDAACSQISQILKRSIQFSLDNRSQAVAHALQYARDMDMEMADEFVGMYVNELTLDYGHRGKMAVERLLMRARDAGLVPDCLPIAFV